MKNDKPMALRPAKPITVVELGDNRLIYADWDEETNTPPVGTIYRTPSPTQLRSWVKVGSSEWLLLPDDWRVMPDSFYLKHLEVADGASL